MKTLAKRFLYMIISLLWSLLLITFVIPAFLFLVTGIRWGEVLDYSHEKLFGYDYY
jgi:hypothetical protein